MGSDIIKTLFGENSYKKQLELKGFEFVRQCLTSSGGEIYARYYVK